MTASAGPALHRVHDEFRDQVRFATPYVREAHPAITTQPETRERRHAHARDYRDRDGIPWPVAVDDLDGWLHRQLVPKPHAAYLMAPDGTVLWRSLWANVPELVARGARGRRAGPRP